MKHPYLEALMILIISIPYLLMVAPLISLWVGVIQLLNGEFNGLIYHFIWGWPLRLARGEGQG